ncbi:MAG: hypothetical protein ACOYM2_14035 [Rectinemataceae bacterium]
MSFALRILGLSLCVSMTLGAFPQATKATDTIVSQEMLPLTSAVYADMAALYLITGNGTPSNARPWSKTEANLILARVDRTSLSDTEAALYDSVAKVVEPGLRFRLRDGFQFSADFDAAFESYLHSNTTFDQEKDWVYDFEKRRPLVKVSLGFSLDDFFYTYCDMQYGRNIYNTQDGLYFATTVYPGGIGAIVSPADTTAILTSHSVIYGAPFLTNVLTMPKDFDYQWPKRAIASVGGARWNLSLSRDKISWGNGHSGNFVLDNHVDYQNFARLDFFSDAFKYEWLNVFFETNPSPGEPKDNKFKILMAHRLEFRIFKGLTFAVSENVMYQNDIFNFGYLNPGFIFHNLNNMTLFNAIAHAELDVSPFKGLNFYAQVVMDQGKAPTEGDAQADAMGYLGGVEYSVALGPGILSSSLEGAYTSPTLYRRQAIDFLMFRKYYMNGYPTGPGYVLSLNYIGYPYGGDAEVLQWDCSYRFRGVGSLSFRLFGMRHGLMDFFLSHSQDGNNSNFANYPGVTPSGDAVQESLVASLSGDFELPRIVSWAGFRFWAELDWIKARTFQASTGLYLEARSDLQFTSGCSLSL